VRSVLLVLAALLLAVAAGCGSSGGGGTTSTGGTTTSKSGGGLDVPLQEQNFSGEDGTATLTAQGQKTRVVIQMASYAANAQPAHIHKGTCMSLDATPAYPLNNVVKGKSTTVVNVPLTKLLDGKYAINMHRSAKQMKIYVACGDIAKNAVPIPTVTTGESGSG
jgi:hypothetical protein